MKLTIDLRLFTLALLIIMAGMLVLWQPWRGLTSKTITVTGEAVVSAAPDEFIFNPTYQKKSDAVTSAISQVSEQGNAIVAKIKALGVAEDKIKTNVTTNPDYDPTNDKQTNQFVANYSLTVTVNNKDLAQKILDYLVTTPALYGVSPQSTFSKETRKKLESQARTNALTDARAKAEQTAQTLSVRLGKVHSVTEGGGFNGPITLEGRSVSKPGIATDQALAPPVLQTGTEDINFSVAVVYRIY